MNFTQRIDELKIAGGLTKGLVKTFGAGAVRTGRNFGKQFVQAGAEYAANKVGNAVTNRIQNSFSPQKNGNYQQQTPQGIATQIAQIANITDKNVIAQITQLISQQQPQR